MKNFFCLILFCFVTGLMAQSGSYFKTYTTNIGQSALSVNTLTAKTYNFNYFIYKLFPDSVSGRVFASIRQKDANEKSFINRGYHLAIKSNDSICCVLEDNKFDLQVMKDYLLLTGDKKTSRFNPKYGFEQFEFPSRIIATMPLLNIGLTYNPAFKNGNNVLLSCVDLNDGNLKWTTGINGEYNWDDILFLNDSSLVIMGSGLHGVNAKSGTTWTYPLNTGIKNTKALVYAPFNEQTWNRLFKNYNTSFGEPFITNLSSNLLITDSMYVAAGNDKIIAVNKDGSLKWEVNLGGKDLSKSLLFEAGGNIVLLNLGVAKYNENIIHYGKPFLLAFNSYGSPLALNYDAELLQNILDIETFRKTKYVANKNQILQIGEDLKVQIWIDLNESRFGKFLEFINGDEYYVEKEGFYVPLNFINDNVVYFKTDHGKIFGLNKNQIEYEYHFTELYKAEAKYDGKTMIKQKSKNILISPNFEMLASFNPQDACLFFNNKLYFVSGKQLAIFNLADLK